MLSSCEQSSPRSRNISSSTITATLNAVEQHLDQNRWVEGLAIARRLVSRVPEEARAHEALGRALIAKSMNTFGEEKIAAHEEAFQEIYKSFLLMPENLQWGIAAAKAAHALNRLEESKKIYNEILKKDSKNPSASFHLAQIHLVEKSPDKAIKCLTIYMESYPNAPIALGALASAYTQLKDYIKSEELIRKALQFNPHDQNLVSIYSYILITQEKYKEVIELLAPQRASREVSWINLESLGKAWEAHGQPLKEAEHWSSVVFVGHPMALEASKKALDAYRRAENINMVDFWQKKVQELQIKDELMESK